MSLFKPVLVNTKNKLDSVDKVLGQYIVVVDTKELYVDKADAEGNIVRVNVSRSGIFIQAEEPTNAVEGDLWFEVEKVLGTFKVTTITVYNNFNYEIGMTWREFVNSSYNIDNAFLIATGSETGEPAEYIAVKGAHGAEYGAMFYDGYILPTDIMGEDLNWREFELF